MNKVIFCDSADKILKTLKELYPVHLIEYKKSDIIVFAPQRGVKGLQFSISVNPRYHHICDTPDIYLPSVLFRTMTAEIVDSIDPEYIVAHLWFHSESDPNENCGHLVVTQKKEECNNEKR